MRESYDFPNDAIDALLDSSASYSKRRKLLQGLSNDEIDAVLDYAKRVIEVEPELANRLIGDIYGMEL